MSIKRFEDGALVWVKLSAKEPRIAGVVLASSDVSTRENGYEIFKVELHRSARGFNGESITSKSIHPVPIQGYKLTKRVE